MSITIKPRNVFIVCFLCSVFLAAPASFAESIDNLGPYIESHHPNGRIDWKNGLVYGVGKGYPDTNGGSKNKALRAAKVTALQSILKVVSGVRLDDRRTLGNIQQEGVTIHLKALIRYEVFESRFVEEDQRPYFEVTCRAPIKGIEGLTAKLLDTLRSQTLPWPQSFPVQEIGGGKPEVEEEVEKWLVLFANDQPDRSRVQPALFPQVVTPKGNSIYDLKMVNESDLKKRGMMQYVVSDKRKDEFGSIGTNFDRFLAGVKSLFSPKAAFADEKKKKRKKRKRYIIKSVQEAEGLMKTNLLISEKDARELKNEDPSGQILKKCRVIVVVNSPIGGIEGALHRYMASMD